MDKPSARGWALVGAITLGISAYASPAEACTLLFATAEPPEVTIAPRGGVWWTPSVANLQPEVAELSFVSLDDDRRISVPIVHRGARVLALRVPRDAAVGSRWASQGAEGVLVVADEPPVPEDAPAPSLVLRSEGVFGDETGPPLGADCGHFGPYTATLFSVAHLVAEVGEEVPTERVAIEWWGAPADAADARSELFRGSEVVLPLVEDERPPRREGDQIHFEHGFEEGERIVSARVIDTLTGLASDVEQVTVTLAPRREELRFACATLAGEPNAGLLSLLIVGGVIRAALRRRRRTR